MRKLNRQRSARLRQAALDGVAAYLADDDAELYNVTDAATKEDAAAAAFNLTALAADAVTALAAATGRDPGEVLRTLREHGTEAAAAVQVGYPHDLDEYDWTMTEAKGWIEVTVRWAGGDKVVTFYDPTRLAQEIQSALAGPGYFAERTLVVVPTVSKEAIEAVVARMAGHGFAEIR
ncbi:hypothetical protein DFJ67_5476 [Asanoa ferruginea]|uniref:Uncharacterized protein n=1 Tax=Asanoa ferruginea TaxID=53367 RepID=A0A3D9ZZY8_9ACTN|nr:hypothetical protein [Asanoa ferruginea]REF99440.1 hypothetical protein DFJ67_5476 [Asanoa ferruginea]GIF49372.1 hypothetical protein Afe04nite_39110 [Asanoa ferruginea]